MFWKLFSSISFSAAQTWELQPYLMGGPLDVKDDSGSHRKYPQYQITAHVKRYMGYYFWNIAIVTVSLICTTFIHRERLPFQFCNLELPLVVGAQGSPIFCLQNLPFFNILVPSYFTHTYLSIVNRKKRNSTSRSKIAQTSLLPLFCMFCKGETAFSHLSGGGTFWECFLTRPP